MPPGIVDRPVTGKSFRVLVAPGLKRLPLANVGKCDEQAVVTSNPVGATSFHFGPSRPQAARGFFVYSSAASGWYSETPASP